MDHNTIEIIQLPVDEWQAYKELRLEALQESPQAFGSSYQDMLARPDSFWQARLEEARRGKKSWLLFARSAAGLVGIIGAVREEANPAEALIISVYVTPPARGSGAAQRLMDAILALCKANGIHKARLGVEVNQIAAIKLYQRSGFVIVQTDLHLLLGDGKHHDEYVMEKVLA